MMRIGRRQIFAAIVTLTCSFQTLAGTLVESPRPQDTKPSMLIPRADKGGLTDTDRVKIGQYLTDHENELPEAPDSMVLILSTTNVWARVLDQHARQVPRRLARQLSPPSEGTVRVIFNRTLYVVDTDTQRVIDHVSASR